MNKRFGFWKADGALRAAAGRAPAAFAVAAAYAVAVLGMDSGMAWGKNPVLTFGLEALAAGVVSALAGVVSEWRGWGRRVRWGLQGAVLAVFAVRVAWGWGEPEDVYGVVSRLALAGAALALTGWALGARGGRAAEGGPRLAVGMAVGGAAALGLALGSGAVTAVFATLFGVKSIEDWWLRFAAGPAMALGALTAVAWATAEKPFELPVAWRALLKWVAVPVHAVFTAVLLAYFLWCAARWNLPDGEIAPFATMAGLGWVALQLLGTGEKGAVGGYARWGGLAVLPLVALQVVALGIRVGQYGLTPVRCGGYAVAAFVAVYAVAAAARPASWVRWGWIALVAWVAGASPWNAVDTGIGAQFRRLEEFRARRAAGEVFDGPARCAIMGAWDATKHYERRGGHYRRVPIAEDRFRAEWGFKWVPAWQREEYEIEREEAPSRTLDFSARRCRSVPCPPASAVKRCRLREEGGRILVRTWDGDESDHLDATDAVMGTWDEDGKAVDVRVAGLDGGRWLLLENASVSFTEKPGGSRHFTHAYGEGWLFSE